MPLLLKRMPLLRQAHPDPAKEAMTAAETHLAKVRWISHLDQPWQAQCPCGWVDKKRSTPLEAQTDADEHNAEHNAR